MSSTSGRPRSPRKQSPDTMSHQERIRKRRSWGSYDELTQIDMPDQVESSHRQHTTTLPVRSGSANSGGSSSGPDELTELEFNRYGWALGTQEAQHLDKPLPKKVTQRRELKWEAMVRSDKKWSKIVVQHYKKVRDRCRKGIPQAMRGNAWLHLCGAHKKLAKNPGLYDKLINGQGNAEVEDEIRRDLHRQFPNHQMFRELGGQGQKDLFNVLKAYAIMRPEVGYCQAQCPIACVLLMHQPAEHAFWTFVQLCDYFLPGYYSKGLEQIQLHGDMLVALLKKFYPLAHKLITKQKIEPCLFMTEWFMCLYCRTLPWPTVLRVWDMFMCEGIRVIFKVGLVILGQLFGSNTPERKKCEKADDLMVTCTMLRQIPESYLDEKEFLRKVIELDLSEKQLQHEHFIQTNLRKAKKKREEQRRNEMKQKLLGQSQNGTAADQNGSATRIARSHSDVQPKTTTTAVSVSISTTNGSPKSTNGYNRNGTQSLPRLSSKKSPSHHTETGRSRNGSAPVTTTGSQQQRTQRSSSNSSNNNHHVQTTRSKRPSYDTAC